MQWNTPLRDLAQADRHIRQATANVMRQQAIVDELSRRGQATQDAFLALATMRKIVDAMHWHRHQIAAHVEQPSYRP